ncbi:MAG: phosphoenolpyruvate carboxykinase, partial [Candidatus Omnitrophica bacterium]|nr:phosphoenolpyruvate carboxykinase [Candidatus Omnitrophota bacterium]
MSRYPTTNKKLIDWVNKMARLCAPDEIVWIDGSEVQKRRIEEEAVSIGELIRLNQKSLPGCFLHRTAPNDVARTEHLT